MLLKHNSQKLRRAAFSVVFVCICVLFLGCIGRTRWPDEVSPNVTRLTPDHGSYSSPRWSPSGDQIAFLSYYGADSTIYTMNADGSSKTPLVSSRTIGASSIGSFDWSPRGKEIIFETFKDGISSLYIRSEDGSMTQISRSKDQVHGCVRWSPKGDLILFCLGDNRALVESKTSQLYLLNVENRKISQLTHPPIDDVLYAEWAPDGSKIALSAYPTDATGKSGQAKLLRLYVIDSDGSNLREINSQLTDISAPAWSPDGRALVFTIFSTSFKEPNLETGIYVMDLSGSAPRAVLEPFPCLSANWSRVRNEIAFFCYDTTLGGYLFKMKMDQVYK